MIAFIVCSCVFFFVMHNRKLNLFMFFSCECNKHLLNWFFVSAFLYIFCCCCCTKLSMYKHSLIMTEGNLTLSHVFLCENVLIPVVSTFFAKSLIFMKFLHYTFHIMSLSQNRFIFNSNFQLNFSMRSSTITTSSSWCLCKVDPWGVLPSRQQYNE